MHSRQTGCHNVCKLIIASAETPSNMGSNTFGWHLGWPGGGSGVASWESRGDFSGGPSAWGEESRQPQQNWFFGVERPQSPMPNSLFFPRKMRAGRSRDMCDMSFFKEIENLIISLRKRHVAGVAARGAHVCATCTKHS